MIFYFSGTGNSRYAAERIAALTGDRAQDISLLKQPPQIEDEKQIGLTFPIYAWGAPEAALDFVKTLGKTRAFCFAVCTCGSEAGLAMKKLARIWPVSSCYSLVMPNNYVVGSDVDEGPGARLKIGEAERELARIASEVIARETVYRVKEGPMAGLKSGAVNFGFNRFARSTKPFYAGGSCDGCGLCARNCPAGTITLSGGKPVWGKRCYQCMRCINECPRRAIQYTKATEGRGRYTLARCLQKADGGAN